jgi:trimeric autotransporter adhesin
MFTRQSRKFQFLAGLMVILAFGAGCTGFFVNPTLTSVAVGPTNPTIQQGHTLQMAATGTYNDGSTKSLTGSAFWSTSDSSIATVNATGLVTGVASGTATITAASGTVSGDTMVTVQLGNIISIAVMPLNSSIGQGGNTKQYAAIATLSDGTTHDITSSASWSASPTTGGTIDSTGLFTSVASGLTSSVTVTITATSGTQNVSGNATLTVTP